MKEFSVAMSLVDFIPVLFFLQAAMILMVDLYNKMIKGTYALFAAGTIDIFLAGFLKALYKLLYSIGVCDFQPLSNLFFPLQALGFLMTGISLFLMIKWSQKSDNYGLFSVAPVYFSGTMIFAGAMVVGVMTMNIILSILSHKMKKKLPIAYFIVSMICSITMGYLSSKNFDKAALNWIAEGVNCIGQGCLFLGVLTLRKAGLRELTLEYKNK